MMPLHGYYWKTPLVAQFLYKFLSVQNFNYLALGFFLKPNCQTLLNNLGTIQTLFLTEYLVYSPTIKKIMFLPSLVDGAFNIWNQNGIHTMSSLQ